MTVFRPTILMSRRLCTMEGTFSFLLSLPPWFLGLSSRFSVLLSKGSDL